MIYETTAQFTTIDSNGNERVVKQRFIVKDAEMHGEAEDVTYDECHNHKDLDVIAVKRSRIKEILNERASDDDCIFMALVADIVVDENGEEKELDYKMAFFAANADAAYTYIKKWLEQGYNMTLVGLTKTKYVDVI